MTVVNGAGLAMMRVLRVAASGREWCVKLGVAVAPADRRLFSRALVAGMIVLAIGLAGCGRKAALDPPPGAAVTTKTCATCAPAPGPKKPDKPFFLDWLL
jgi:hypothetical protein